jgi:predicted MPP superfamily phosphohydrolase
MKRRLILILLLVQTFLLSAQNFSFVYLPDIHLRPDSTVSAGFDRMVRAVNKLHPDFVLTGGDMIYTAKTVDGKKAAVLFDYMDMKFSKFRMPVYMTMGNHENVGITKESGIDKTDPDWGKQMFEKRYNKRYYSFVFGGWKFFVLDGIRIREPEKDYTQGIDNEQIEWLRNELAATDTTMPAAISMHTPFVNPHDVISTESGPVSSVCDSVLKMFKGHNLKLVLEGHTHVFMNLYYDGTHYLSGGSSEINTDGKNHGFLFIRVKNAGEDVRFIPLPRP